ncbi:MAG: tetratricopeptide repeat protein [Planktomarina sp.]
MRAFALLFVCLMGCTAGSPFGLAPRGAPVENGLIIGDRLMLAGEADLALQSYTRALGEFGMTAQVAASLGRANLALGRLGQAEPFLRQATEAPNATPEMWNNLGVLLLETGRLVEARQVFRRGFALSNGQNTTILQNLALTLQKLDGTGYTGL